MAWWAEHDFGSVCAATGRVRGEIFGAHVRFGLNDPPDAPPDAIVVD
jgi:hypothetical protein